MKKTIETGLKEGGGIEMSTTSAFHIRDALLSFAFVFTYYWLHYFYFFSV